MAGNETTRNAITHGMIAFFDHPEQWELFKAERPETAADEIVRWATPVTAFQRTALGRHRRSAASRSRRASGWCCSTGRPTSTRTSSRSPSSSTSCATRTRTSASAAPARTTASGANLARLEIDLIFNAIADDMPDIKLAGDPERLRSGWLNGIKALPVSYR